jgi:hypothetical protein
MFQNGALFDPTTDARRATASEGAHAPRAFALAFWTGKEIVVWGGDKNASDDPVAGGARTRGERLGVIIVIGDIHGCADELADLLDRVGPSAEDTIVGLGDLVDRGPRPVAVVERFRDDPRCRAILGNHEDKHLRWQRGELAPALSQTICREQAGAAYADMVAWFATLPLYLDLAEALIVHAGYEPDLPLEQQPRNVLLRCKWPGEHGLGGDPMRWIGRYRGERPVVYGHIVHWRSPRIEGRTFGIDTGVYCDGTLTALLLPSEKLVSVPARANHWPRVRGEYAGRQARKRPPAAPPEPALIEEALALVERIAAKLPQAADRVERRQLAATLGRDPALHDLAPLLFAGDKRRQLLLERHPSREALRAAVMRWRTAHDDGPRS